MSNHEILLDESVRSVSKFTRMRPRGAFGEGEDEIDFTSVLLLPFHGGSHLQKPLQKPRTGGFCEASARLLRGFCGI